MPVGGVSRAVVQTGRRPASTEVLRLVQARRTREFAHIPAAIVELTVGYKRHGAIHNRSASSATFSTMLSCAFLGVFRAVARARLRLIRDGCSRSPRS